MTSEPIKVSEELSLFREAFKALTGTRPFPWQEDLYDRFFAQGVIPASCNIPTGLGKTSVVAIWLIALAHHLSSARRLIYVVNRRTVVDQTTSEVERLRENLQSAGLFGPLSRLCALPLKNGESPLAISTLRGQFADNRDWSADPARPAVIVGTVDMIGSRLLFAGYRLGFKMRPLHAGFLGQDVLFVHDEAHLEPAFQKLLTAVSEEQKRSKEFLKFHLMALTATSRDGAQGEAFGLTEKEKQPPEALPVSPKDPIHTVWQRLKARKRVKFHPASKPADVAEEIARLALRHKDSGKAILVFVRSLENVEEVRHRLTNKKEGVPETQVQILTGTLRGFERDRLAKSDPMFLRFLLKESHDTKTVYLICTSAGEIGIDISADHMVCDLTPLDSMIQRLGRVNRRGEGDAEVDVVYEREPDPEEQDKPFEKARWRTLDILGQLPLCTQAADDRRDASPFALSTLDRTERQDAFTPEPVVLAVSDILFDSWALTTIRQKLPGRPAVEPYLHGLADWEPPYTQVAWRTEVEMLTGDLLDGYKPESLLEDYSLKPHEILRDRSDRVFKQLEKIGQRRQEIAIWLVDEDGAVEAIKLSALANKDDIEKRTVLLPPCAGGLEKGFLKGDSKPQANESYDVADEWLDANGNHSRLRVWDDEPAPSGMRLIRTIDLDPYADEAEGESASVRRYWRWYESPRSGDSDGSKAATGPVEWSVHNCDVLRNAEAIVSRLPLSEEIRKAVLVAAKFHDLGKRRALFQRILGNTDMELLLAKSGRKRSGRLPETYRHEFGSLLDLETQAEFAAMSDEMRELAFHLIAAHHGRARPHFPPDEAFDPEPNGRDVEMLSAEVPRRFARLQKRYGRWGLAYLESLLRAADYAASANPSAFVAVIQ